MAEYNGVLYPEGKKPLTDEGHEFLGNVTTNDLCDVLRKRAGVEEFSFDYTGNLENKLHITLERFGRVFVIRD